jgi:hypothetical protein
MFHFAAKGIRNLASMAAVATAVAVTVASTPAFASVATGNPSQVAYPLGTLVIQFNGINYIGVTSPGCGLGANTVDTVKVWQSLATAALLSGKNVNISFSSCLVNGSTVNYIWDVLLVR